MGCDMTIAVEVQRDDGHWEWVSPPERVVIATYSCHGRRYHDWWDVRSYVLFAILANVRNYYSFNDRTCLYQPIKEPVGLPDDMSPQTRSMFEDDMDYHSRTFYTVQELFDWDWDKEAGQGHSYRALAGCFLHLLDDLDCGIYNHRIRLILAFDN